MQKKKLFQNHSAILLSTIISTVMMLIVFAIKGAFVFGGSSIAAGDALAQYVPLLGQLHSRLFTGELFYTFNDGLGYNLFATGVYYFFSPFNFLISLIPFGSPFLAFDFAVLLKVTGSAFTFSYFLTKSFDKKDLSVTVFSLCYAFCGFFSAYAFNIMWLDALVFLPLIALSIERIVEEKSGVLYCVSLAIAIFSSFYTGFMLCIFSVLYFLVRIFGTEGLTSSYNKHLLEEKDETEVDEEFAEYEGRAVIPIIFRFGFYSVLAGILCAVTLYPLYIALGNTFLKTSPQDTLLFSFWDFLSAHLFGTNTGKRYTADTIPFPFLYSGIISLLLAPLLLFIKKIRLSERITYSFLTLFLIASLLLRDINVLWHGFSVPAGFPYRFAFLYTFMLVLIAFKVFLHIKSIKNVFLFIPPVLAVIASVLLLFFGNEFYGIKEMIINIILTLLISAILFAVKNFENKRKLLTAALIIIISIELTINTASSIIYDGKSPEILTSQRSAVKNAVTSINDNSFYRSEAPGTPFPLEFGLKGSFFGLNSVSTFNSLNDEILAHSIGGLGNTHNLQNAVGYSKQTPVFNSFFSIKYLYDFSGESFNGKYYTNLGEFPSKDKKAAANAYEYNYHLPVMFCVNKDITNWIGSFLSDFHSQNVLFESAAGISNLFSIVKSQNRSGKNTEIKSIPDMIASGAFKKDSLDSYPPFAADEYRNGLYDVTILDQEKPENSEITLSYIIDTDSPLYFFYSSNVFDDLTVKVNGEKKDYSFSSYLISFIIPIENTKKGDTLEFTAKMSKHILEVFEKGEKVEKANAPVWLKLYSMDEEKFIKGFDYLKEGALNITEY